MPLEQGIPMPTYRKQELSIINEVEAESDSDLDENEVIERTRIRLESKGFTWSAQSIESRHRRANIPKRSNANTGFAYARGLTYVGHFSAMEYWELHEEYLLDYWGGDMDAFEALPMGIRIERYWDAMKAVGCHMSFAAAKTDIKELFPGGPGRSGPVHCERIFTPSQQAKMGELRVQDALSPAIQPLRAEIQSREQSYNAAGRIREPPVEVILCS